LQIENLLGSITLFEKRGSYQINISDLQLEGVGELQKKIEELKKKLSNEGIFDSENKKKLPFLPKRIGIVTSPTGAAYKDILKVAIRRFPNIEILLAPAKVQGEGAEKSIVKAINELNKKKWNIDIIIAGRGGGSFEDLMAFNEEIVVRAFADSKIPIVSAVGHQIDHPLSDDAADIFVATPSAAAELVVPIKKELKEEIEYYELRSNNALEFLLKNLKTRLNGLAERKVLKDPFELLNLRSLYLSDIENKIIIAIKSKLSSGKERLNSIPNLNRSIKEIFKEKNFKYNIALQNLENLSPLSTMKRGYAVTRKNKKIIKSVTQVKKDDKIEIELIDGSLNCNILEKNFKDRK